MSSPVKIGVSKFYREMACYLCGCCWTVDGEHMTQRPSCPECGGCRRQGIHLRDLFFECYNYFPEKAMGPVTGAVVFCSATMCPETSLCTTAARDTFGMAYDEQALQSLNYIPKWHFYQFS